MKLALITYSKSFIKELAEMIASEVGFTGRFVWDMTRPNGQPRRCLDVSRAKQLFGFEVRTGFREGIRRAVDWFWRQPPANYRSDLRIDDRS